MNSTVRRFPFRLQKSYQTIGRFYTVKPTRLGITFLIGLLVLSFIIWGLNLELLGYVLLNSSISLQTKVSFIGSVYAAHLSNYRTLFGLLELTFVALASINITLIAHAIKHKYLTRSTGGSSATGGVLALLAAGCVACGTSLAAPLLSVLGISGLIVSGDVAVYVYVLAIIMILYSLYELGKLLLMSRR